MTGKRWQDWVNFVLGIWLFLSPWLLSFRTDIPGASWNFFVIGIAIIVFALIALNSLTLWEEGVNLILGIWMIISPWVLRYSGDIVATRDAVIVGIIVALLSIWVLFSQQSGGGHHAITH